MRLVLVGSCAPLSVGMVSRLTFRIFGQFINYIDKLYRILFDNIEMACITSASLPPLATVGTDGRVTLSRACGERRDPVRPSS